MKDNFHHKVKIIAHRGASHDAPENTLAAIDLAWQQGADAVEIDVHLSKDGEIVVMHDTNTRRTTGIDGEIAALTRDELRRLDAGAWKAPAFCGQRIPTLDEALALVPPQKSLVIEIKSKAQAIIEPLRICLERAGVLPQHIVLIGFDYELMKAVKSAVPHLGVLWLCGMPSAATSNELIARCREANFDGLNLSFAWPLDENFVRRIKDADLQLFVWTVDDSDVARRLALAGVDGITTNRPGWLREQLQGERG